MFTQNQVRQLYVAKAYESNATGLDTAGDIMLVSPSGQTDMYFNFVNADGEVMRTDLINKDNIMSITVTPAEKMKYTSKGTLVVLDSNVASGNPVGGEDYMINITIPQMYYKSDAVRGFKYGVVHATSSMSVSDFYKEMCKSLVANMSREAWDILKIYAVTSSITDASAVTTGNTVEIKADSDVPTGTVYGVYIDEAEQAWKLGTMKQERVYYEAKSDEIVVSGDYQKWGKETVAPGLLTIENGKNMADMEWFYHGERGDIYRESAWPNNWPNKMLINPEQKYDTIDIHYYWQGANHAIQKSEKDITLVCANGVASSVVTAIKNAVPAASGLAYSSGAVSTVVLE